MPANPQADSSESESLHAYALVVTPTKRIGALLRHPLRQKRTKSTGESKGARNVTRTTIDSGESPNCELP